MYTVLISFVLDLERIGCDVLFLVSEYSSLAVNQNHMLPIGSLSR